MSAILHNMLDRLFAGLTSGPNLNCRPHSSRQRVDWTHFAKLQDGEPGEALARLLSDKQATQLHARVTAPRTTGRPPTGKKRSGQGTPNGNSGTENTTDPTSPESPIETPEDRQHREDWSAQQALLSKLRGLAEDARDYEQDTGAHVLHVGFPLLSLPPGAGSLTSAFGTKRLLAPIAFVPVSLEVRSGAQHVIAINGLHDGADFLVPNEALFAWLERQTGQRILSDSTPTAVPTAAEAPTDNVAGDAAPTEPASDAPVDLPEPSTASSSAILDPLEEINDLIRRVATVLHLPPMTMTVETLTKLRSAPRAEDDQSQAEIVPAAVLGLFPMNNQSLLRDTQAMVDDPSTLQGPIQSFINAESLLGEAVTEAPAAPVSPTSTTTPAKESQRQFERERLVTSADPCQARAVRLASETQGLVIHGPPGTGKSQTITNIIGDHLSRGERVLLVCDKRTALDVVFRRLDHIGLGSLCALIHDPQHDQRNLYMQIREQLEQLTDTVIGDRATAQLRTLDKQLQKSHETLTEAWSLVMSVDQQRKTSFHQRMGEWLQSALPALVVETNHASTSEPSKPSRSARRSRSITSSDESSISSASVEELDSHWLQVRDIVDRAIHIRLADHPWKACIGISLDSFLQRPVAELRENLAAIVESAIELDRTFDPATPDFLIPEDLESDSPAEPISFPQQLTARQDLAAKMKHALAELDADSRKKWANLSAAALDRIRQRFHDATPHHQGMQTPLDPGLLMVLRDKNLTAAEIAPQFAAIEAYLRSCDQWYSWFAFGTRKRANLVLQAYGLPPGKSGAQQLRQFLSGVTARRLVADAIDDVSSNAAGRAWSKTSFMPDDATLLADWDRVTSVIQVLDGSTVLGLAEPARTALANEDHDFVAALESSTERAECLEELRLDLVESRLFRAEWLRSVFLRVCGGESIVDQVKQLAGSLDSLGEVLRIQALLAQSPAWLSPVIEQAIATSTDVDSALNTIRHRVLSAEIDQWLKSDPTLQALDGTQLTHLLREIRRLEHEKQPCVRDLILDLWVRRQRERLLASTGTRLKSLGADLRRRLTTRGERAMRLRQVIAVGDRIPGGDPLFDLKPVWMASPETVAQIFPRQELFDVVIFDEASQCRLEDALPVLTRAKRVVIAGDPKQLPPTRFFESAMVTSDNFEAETDQELFEAHQSDVEDLLTAALSIDIHESHLDVHYRSRNADLVEFSNQQFYGSRLQAIPGHPRNRIRFAPITLYHVAGIYEERSNAAEAAQVVKIVADLLRRSEPPSIGIACFNLTQRDLILESLAELAAEDTDFAGRLAAARSRVGAGAFEGLFVKNLENVQGDERDHMIISTTYGPDRQGKFYRRFGPLGQAGGGRRLNVLITRAREEVHLVTSIPPELYRHLPSIPEGQNPGGGWLLFAYLAYAEHLADSYGEWRAESDEPESELSRPTRVIERPSRTPSQFARQLALLMATRHNLGSDTPWGNDGFCVDLAFHHPDRPEDRTLGLLLDGTRFQNADDPVAWDVFRTAILEEQGWQLNRCWTPQFFRDPEGFLRRFAEEASRIADTDPDPEGIPVEP